MEWIKLLAISLTVSVIATGELIVAVIKAVIISASDRYVDARSPDVPLPMTLQNKIPMRKETHWHEALKLSCMSNTC